MVPVLGLLFVFRGFISKLLVDVDFYSRLEPTLIPGVWIVLT